MSGVPARIWFIATVLAFCLPRVFGQLNLPASEPIWGYGLSNALPGLRFDQPVGIVAPPGETNRLFVLERQGRIIVVSGRTNPKATTFLDISSTTWSGQVEAGLLGLAFHPDYSANGRFFVYRTTLQNCLRTQLSEFRRSTRDPNQADINSERLLIAQLDNSDAHNAGDLKFGPDGYLYLSLGDETPANEDRHETPQAIDKGLFGGIIRIDVDAREENLIPNSHGSVAGEYRIPRDNPFVGVREFNGLAVDPDRVRTEFYAVGLRNPWRFAFDPRSGEMICADVGSGSREEINIIEKGGNYGWPYFEGTLRHVEDAPHTLTLPLYEYAHGKGNFQGHVIIGGIVYEGRALPGMEGMYLFADFESGHLWALNTRERQTNATWLTARRGLSTITKDPLDGEVLTANFINGTIEKLVYRSLEESGVPLLLSEVNAFEDLTELSPRGSALPYEVINPLWSDGAFKQRWVDLSGADGKIGFSGSEPWTFPSGAVWIKHFELELTKGAPESRRRLETRFLVQTTNGVYGLSYRWGDSLTNATLLPPYPTNETFLVYDGGTVKTQVWNYPGWDQCAICHNASAGGALSFNTHQLNRPLEGEDGKNQLLWLAEKDLFANPQEIQPESLPNLVALDDPIAPAQHKIRSYLFSNCAQCHQPGYLLGPLWDARITTPFAEAKVVGASSYFYPPPMKIIAPHSYGDSFLLVRAATRSPLFQMPPLATSVPDEEFLTVLTNWVDTFPDDSWTSTDIGRSLAEGAAEQRGEIYRISAAAGGLEKDSIFFFHRNASGATEIRSRIVELKSSTPEAEAGLMMRGSLSSDAGYGAVYVRNGMVRFQARAPGSTQLQHLGSSLVHSTTWLRLVKSGTRVSAWTSADAVRWDTLGTVELDMGREFRAGLFAAAAAPAVNFAAAEFDTLSVNSVEVKVPFEGPAVLPQEIWLPAVVDVLPETEATVTFFAGERLIGAVTNAPYAISWAATDGTVPITAMLTTRSSAITSQPIALELLAPLSHVNLAGVDTETAGNWTPRYGNESALIPGYITRSSPGMRIDTPNAQVSFLGTSSNPYALATQRGRVASVLRADQRLEVSYIASDYLVHQGALYFMDWAGLGATQIVTFFQNGMKVAGPERIEAQTGKYLRFVFRGDLTIQIENPWGPAHVAGIFSDPLEPAAVEILSPGDRQSIQQPAPLELEVAAIAPDREIERLEVWNQERQLAVFTSPPFKSTITNIAFGEHTLRAFATDAYGARSASDLVKVQVEPPTSSARFIGLDSNTLGTWTPRYGSAGYWIVEDHANIPDFIRVTLQNERYYTFAHETRSPSALERPLGGERIAACLVGSPEFAFHVDVLDGRSTTVGFYFLSGQCTERILEIEVRDPAGRLMDQRQLREYGEGKYMFWEIQGRTTFKFSARSINAVVSAFFVEDLLTNYDLWKHNAFSPAELEEIGGEFDGWDADRDGFSNALEYALGFDPRREDDRPALSWSFNGESFSLTVSARSVSPEVRPQFERSEDLVTWQPLGAVPSFRDWVAEIGIGGKNRQFIRLRAVRN